MPQNKLRIGEKLTLMTLFFLKGESEDSATPPQKKKKTVVEPPAKGKVQTPVGHGH